MKSRCSGTSRRKVLKATVAVVCCAGAKIPMANASRSKIVDQITDPTTTAAKDMFRFEPNFLMLSTGDELTFLNSTAEHTVHTVKELWPDGVKHVKIANKKEVTVSFDQEGYYGFRCQRHGRYGMVMLVVVGRPPITDKVRKSIRKMRAKPRERSGFVELLKRYESA